MAEGHHSQSHHTSPQSTNPNRICNQTTRSAPWHVESSHHMHEEDFSSSCSPTWLEQAYASTDQSHPDEFASSNRGKWKMGQRQGSHLSNAMRARLRPQDQRVQALLHISNALKARLGQPKQEASLSFQPPQAKLPTVLESKGKALQALLVDDWMICSPYHSTLIS